MSDHASSGDTATRALLRDADACVKCGACLPACPTYARSQHEADSPRGRIGLVQGLAAGRLAADPLLAYHLDGCLQCRMCEAVCPAQVRIVAVIRGGQGRLRDAGTSPGWDAFVARQAARLGWLGGWLAARFRPRFAAPAGRRA